ncbi:MAG: RNA 3'-terminal phosphate cyclase, partial [Planctomycetota bacterium]
VTVTDDQPRPAFDDIVVEEDSAEELSGDADATEVDAAADKLNWPPGSFHVCETNDSRGPGNIMMVELQSEHVREVFTGFGRQGARAERVAMEAVDQTREYLAAEVPVGKHLADQLLLPLGIAAARDGAVSEFVTLPLTRHSATHINILQSFLGVAIDVDKGDGVVHVRVG